MIGSLESTVVDCPEPQVLARFYSELLGYEIVGYDPDWAELAPEGGGRPLIAFQQVDDYKAPEWPSQSVPQQFHFDVRVEDFDVAEPAVLALGASLTGEGTSTFRVYRDPAGHPFCLIVPSD